MTDDPKDVLEALAPELAAYVEQLHAHDHPVLQRMEAEARQSGFPIVGPVVGRVLMQMVMAHRPARIVELGSGSGYSALWFALGMVEAGIDGTIVLTDGDPDKIAAAEDNLAEAGLGHLCEMRCGDAVALLRQDTGPVDMVFMDIDKEQYPDALDPIVDSLSTGGVMLVDNMLWYGRPFLQSEPDAATRGVLDFTKAVMEHPELVSSVLSVRDGLAWAIRR